MSKTLYQATKEFNYAVGELGLQIAYAFKIDKMVIWLTNKLKNWVIE